MSAEMVSVLFDIMRDKMIPGERLEIRNVGAFDVKDAKPKPYARNPYTSETTYVPARGKIVFRPGKLMKEELHTSEIRVYM